MKPIVLRGGVVVDGLGHRARIADVRFVGDLILSIGTDLAEIGDDVRDVRGLTVMPGFIDPHVHAASLFGETQGGWAFAPLLAQGVTSVVLGGDGFASCSGEGNDFAAEYFSGIDGPIPAEVRHANVSQYLTWLNARAPVNAGVLVPANTLRIHCVGPEPRSASEDEIAQMADVLRSGLSAGALGLGSGLEYPPGTFSTTHELRSLNHEVARVGAVHASHMRGYGARIGAGMSEITELAEATGARQHVAHLRGSANDVEPLLDDCEKRGVDMTFDSYPYQAGSTLLSARVLAPELTVRGLSVALAWVHAADERELLALSGSSVGGALLASNAASSDELGVPLAEIARRRDLSLGGLLHALLIDSDLAVTVIVPASVSSEAESDYARLLAHSRQMACSDGIYVGDHPHPRGWGAFTRVLARHVVERGDLTIEQAAVHLSARAARVFGIPDRGVLEKGKAADIVVLDLPALRDTANLTSPRELATGVHSVYVNGHETWRDGTVTAPHSGRAIRRIRAQQ